MPCGTSGTRGISAVESPPAAPSGASSGEPQDDPREGFAAAARRHLTDEARARARLDPERPVLPRQRDLDPLRAEDESSHIRSALLTINWLVYVWGIGQGEVIECSLGYFLVPLVNVAAGRFVLHEHLRRLQWLAIALAADLASSALSSAPTWAAGVMVTPFAFMRA